MKTNDNQTTPQIYYRPLHKWIEVTLEEKQNWERFIGTTRKSKQRAGTCCIPYKKSYKCDGLCEECEYRCIRQHSRLPEGPAHRCSRGALLCHRRRYRGRASVP